MLPVTEQIFPENGKRSFKLFSTDSQVHLANATGRDKRSQQRVEKSECINVRAGGGGGGGDLLPDNDN